MATTEVDYLEKAGKWALIGSSLNVLLCLFGIVGSAVGATMGPPALTVALVLLAGALFSLGRSIYFLIRGW